jgi:hypothetical protein
METFEGGFTMSEWKGKESWSRVKDKKAWDTNFDNIFRKSSKIIVIPEPKEEIRGKSSDSPIIDDLDLKSALRRTVNLFLDDIRFPARTFIVNGVKEPISLQEVSGVSPEDWVIVRNYEEFVSHIRHFGAPKKVSFDHDLCDDHMNEYLKIRDIPSKKFDYAKFKTKTGFHCAQYLIQHCADNSLDFPEYFIHTYNHIGYENIEKEITKYVHKI